MAHDIVRECSISTARLDAGEWHEIAHRYGLDLVAAVSAVLTTATTTELPFDWRGDFDDERAARWIEARDEESPTLLVIERQTGRPVGLLILFEAVGEREPSGVDVRLGYVLAESAWGQGMASELVGGVVTWARSTPSIESITGAVASNNVASARVLQKNGFMPSEIGANAQAFRLTF